MSTLALSYSLHGIRPDVQYVTVLACFASDTLSLFFSLSACFVVFVF